jgi:hypothetical protein
VTVHYGYNYTADPDQPDWFVKQWKAYYGTDEPLREKLSMDELARDELSIDELSRDEL